MSTLHATIDRQGHSKASETTVKPPSFMPRRVLSGAYELTGGSSQSGSRRGEFGLFSSALWDTLVCFTLFRGEVVPALGGSSHSALKAGQVATCSCGYFPYVLYFFCGYFKVYRSLAWRPSVGLSCLLQPAKAFAPIRPIIKGRDRSLPSLLFHRRTFRLNVYLFRPKDFKRRRIVFSLRRQACNVLLPIRP